MTQEELMDYISEYVKSNHPNKKVSQYDLNQMWLWVDTYIEEELPNK